MKSESEFVRGAESYNIIRGLGNSCAIERLQCFKMLSKNIDSWFLGFGSPNLSFMETSTESYSSHNNSMHYLIEQLLPDILRISLSAPYSDLRENCHNLLLSLERRNFRIPRVKHVGHSHFISENKIDDVIHDRNGDSTITDEYLNSLLTEHFEEWGRIENYIMMMCYHPTYLEQYLKVYNNLFRGDGSLPYLDRYYVAIMAAAQMHCRELIYRFITEFLAAGGDSAWLTGLQKAPGRLKALSVLNQYLCHQPWQIDPKNLEQLTRCPENMYHISKSQLLHAVVIMTHVYSLSTFIFGCGVNNEIDHPLALTTSTSSYIEGSINLSRNTRSSEDLSLSMSTDSSVNEFASNNHHSHSDIEDERIDDDQDDCRIEVIMERLREAQEDDDELAEAEVAKMFLSVEKENETITQNLSHPTNVNPLIERFVGDANFGYVNFNSRAFKVMRIQDYSWSDEGCCLADRIYPDIGTILEKKFNCSCELTYNMMGDKKNIDTTLFRLSVWIYVHSLFGIRHDDFNYAQLDQLLTKPLKLFIKKSITKPCTVNKSDFLRFLPEFKFSEKIHVALMAADARQQACLLYVLRSI